MKLSVLYLNRILHPLARMERAIQKFPLPAGGGIVTHALAGKIQDQRKTLEVDYWVYGQGSGPTKLADVRAAIAGSRGDPTILIANIRVPENPTKDRLPGNRQRRDKGGHPSTQRQNRTKHPHVRNAYTATVTEVSVRVTGR